MRTAPCLTLIAVGAIFTFALTARLGFLNLRIAGVVIMATGIADTFLPRRGQRGWLRRRAIVRRSPRGPVAGRAGESTPFTSCSTRPLLAMKATAASPATCDARGGRPDHPRTRPPATWWLGRKAGRSMTARPRPRRSWRNTLRSARA